MCFQRDEQIIQNVPDDVLCFDRERDKSYKVYLRVFRFLRERERDGQFIYEMYMSLFVFSERGTNHMKCT